MPKTTNPKVVAAKPAEKNPPAESASLTEAKTTFNEPTETADMRLSTTEE